jgi:hypothetical protein
MSEDNPPKTSGTVSRPNLEVIDGGRLDAVNSSDRVTLSQLAVDPAMIGTTSTKMHVTVSAGRPAPGAWIRTHPDPHYWMVSAGLKSLDGTLYLATTDVLGAVSEDVRYYQLVTFTTRAGALGVWPIVMPGPDGKPTGWTQSALEAATTAKKEWVRIRANMSSGGYEVHRLLVTIPEPDWPDLTFEQILNLAFKDRIITAVDHPLVRQLRGLA